MGDTIIYNTLKVVLENIYTDLAYLSIPNKWLFSRAAATLSLSLSCLFTANSDACVPGVIIISILNLSGRERNNFTRMHSPINVAIEQWGIVGVN